MHLKRELKVIDAKTVLLLLKKMHLKRELKDGNKKRMKMINFSKDAS